MPSYNHLLIATKFTPACDAAARRGAELALLFGARVTLLHVIEHFPEDLPIDEIGPENADPQATLEQRARERLAQEAAGLGLPAVNSVVLVSRYSARHEILEQVRERRVELLVLGSPVQSGLLGNIGSTAGSVSTQAGCDVLLVRAGSQPLNT